MIEATLSCRQQWCSILDDLACRPIQMTPVQCGPLSTSDSCPKKSKETMQSPRARRSKHQEVRLLESSWCSNGNTTQPPSLPLKTIHNGMRRLAEERFRGVYTDINHIYYKSIAPLNGSIVFGAFVSPSGRASPLANVTQCHYRSSPTPHPPDSDESTQTS